MVFRRVLGQRDEITILGHLALTRGGDSNLAWRSLIRLLLPFIRNVPSISVAVLCRLWKRGIRHEADGATEGMGNNGGLGVGT